MDILEEEKLYFGRTRHPHCRTCVCPEIPVKVKSKVTVSSRIPRQRSPPPPRNLDFRGHDCGCRQPMESEWDSGPQPQQLQMPSPVRMDRRFHSGHKYGLLEKWFKRFDFDSNGLLDLFELRTLINFLGVRAGDDYCRRLLCRADRDGDGLLTFPEFLMMWRQAQDENELLEIIREYDLYPDVVQVETFRRQRPKQQVIETVQRHYGRPRRQCCGCDGTVTKTVRRTPDEDRIEYKTKVSHRSHEKLPIFSCYR